ncbi:MAG TPA: four helix bundle protein [Thermoflexia bacterium]|nr:four helix bundle protein [Thermoflexia bacterium]
MTYEEWERTVPEELKRDVLWRMEAYRLALFAAELGWYDVTKLMKDRRTWGVADQLYRSLGSISANLAEGYSRGSGRDRARFYEYSLGSARESRDWYYKGRHILGPTVTAHRLRLLTQVIRLLLTMIPQQRGRTLGEAPVPYGTSSVLETVPTDEPDDLEILLRDVPLP